MKLAVSNIALPAYDHAETLGISQSWAFRTGSCSQSGLEGDMGGIKAV